MPCSAPSTDLGPGASPTPIQGFGVPFSLPASSSQPAIPSNQPEDLNALFAALEFILPANTLKAPLSPNYDRTVFDVIMKLLDGFMPFLALYKFFLPILKMIICIIEVICSLLNPFKLVEKIQKLFRECLPELLSLFPSFALVVMILSILNLLIALITYIITEVTNLANIIQENIKIIERAFTIADDRSILTATQKIGNVLCSFQNLFVLLSLFETFIAVFQEILKLVFSIPPCSDNSSTSCCTPDVCPAFIKNNTDIKASTGTLQYFNEVSIDSGLTLPVGFAPITFDIRKESWQFYDSALSTELAFINITHAFDLPDGYNTVFFPTDANYTASTNPTQVPYLVNLRLFYNPTTFGIMDPKGARFIRINSCIVLNAPSTSLSNFDNSTTTIANGVLNLAGGLVFEDDNFTQITINGTQATLNTLIHQASESGIIPPPLRPTDGVLFSNVTYDFIIQHPILLSKSLITLGCIPSVNMDRTFINTVFSNANFALLNNLVLPDVTGTHLCLSTAVAGLQNNVSTQALATFQATTTACLSNLQDQATTTATALIGIGFDPYKSTFTITPTVQFTTQAIQVTVTLNESNGASLSTNLSTSVADSVAKNISATITLGDISNFVYDGYSTFTANITSPSTGSGTIMVAYEHQTISTLNIPSDLTQSPSITPNSLSYKFVYSPIGSDVKNTSVGDTFGEPQFDRSDVARE